jgi:hypothetical protein
MFEVRLAGVDKEGRSEKRGMLLDFRVEACKKKLFISAMFNKKKQTERSKLTLVKSTAKSAAEEEDPLASTKLPK